MAQQDIIAHLDHIMDFQLSDLRKASICATANFLASIGAMNTIEFLGGVKNGKLGSKSDVRSRFIAGVNLLGGEYVRFGADSMWGLRNSLTHQYVPTLEGVSHITIANDWAGHRAILENGSTVTLNVAQLIKDLERAWEGLRNQLLNDAEMLHRVSGALARMPKLL